MHDWGNARGPISTRRSLAVAVLVASAVFGGCASVIIPSDSRVNRDKIASAVEWNGVLVGNESAEAFAWDRTAMIIQGADGIVQGSSPGSGNGRTLSFTPTLQGKAVKRASAGAVAAISTDGYWLTAAHCTEPGPLMIVQVGRDSTLRYWPARIIWRAAEADAASSKDLPAERDLAILHTPTTAPIRAFTLAKEAPERGRVLCLGSGVGTNAWSAGRITGVGGRVGDDVTLIRHDAPVSFGDSGGPAMLEDGTLAGVNVERAWGFLAKDESTAAWIKPEFLDALMAADRRSRGVDAPIEPESTPRPAEGVNDAGL